MMMLSPVFIQVVVLLMIVSSINCIEDIVTNIAVATSRTNTVTRKIAEETTYCNCQYTLSSDDESDCRVYGQLGDDILIPWYRSSQDCLDLFDIKVSFMDVDQLLSLCPNSDGTDASISGIINEIRFNTNTPANRAIMSYYNNFFIESNDNSGNYELKENIINSTTSINSTSTSTGSTVDCTTSESDCWNIIKEYFTVNSNELNVVCKEFYNKYIMNQELEQAIIRGRICQEIDSDSTLISDTTNSCYELANQINDIKTEQSSKACSAYELGPGEQDLPQCSTGTDSDTTDSDTTDSNTTDGDTTTKDDNSTSTNTTGSRDINTTKTNATTTSNGYFVTQKIIMKYYLFATSCILLLLLL